jgi:prepilin peptidase CpaA
VGLLARQLPWKPSSIIVMHFAVFWPTVATVLIASITDLRRRRIPNWLVGLSFAAALITATATRGGAGLGQSLQGALLGSSILGVLYLLGGMGMGDVKLCAAVGAWIGPGQLIMALVMMGLAGGVIALGWATAGGFLRESLEGAGNLVFGWTRRGRGLHQSPTLESPGARSIPYAPAIAVGAIFSFWAHS